MSKLKISYRFFPDSYHGLYYKTKPKRKPPYPVCRACGARLVDPVSIARGYGSKCWKEVPIVIVLDIPAGETS